MPFEAGRGGSGLEPKLAGLRLTPADFAGPRRRTPQDLGRILAGPGTGPSGPPVLEGPIQLVCIQYRIQRIQARNTRLTGRAIGFDTRSRRGATSYIESRGNADV